jgi:MGT family glycosyltransferase
VAQIGFATLSVPGHLHPSLTLASALRGRGHEVIFFTRIDGAEKIHRAGFRTEVFGEQKYTSDFLKQRLSELSTLSGLKAIRYTIDLVRSLDELALAELPERLSLLSLDGMIVDQLFPAAAAVSQAAKIPYVTLSNALPVNPDPLAPPVFSHDRPSGKRWSSFRNGLLNRMGNYIFHPVIKQLNCFQKKHGLPKIRTTADLGSDLAHLVQIPPGFDFERKQQQDKMHYVGPLHSLETREEIAFPWHQIDSSKPLIYASMGTLQNRIRHVFSVIAEACADLPVQLVISLGGSADPEEFPRWKGDPLVVRFAPQLRLLQKASVCVTHAGVNTAMESLACGVPMLAIPVTNDQPGVAARIEHFELGKRIQLGELKVAGVKHALGELLNQSKYRQNAMSMQKTIQHCGGPDQAVAIIEQVFSTGCPVPLSRSI